MIMAQRCQAIPYRLTTKSPAHPPFSPFVDHIADLNTKYLNTFFNMSNLLPYGVFIRNR